MPLGLLCEIICIFVSTIQPLTNSEEFMVIWKCSWYMTLQYQALILISETSNKDDTASSEVSGGLSLHKCTVASTLKYHNIVAHFCVPDLYMWTPLQCLELESVSDFCVNRIVTPFTAFETGIAAYSSKQTPVQGGYVILLFTLI